MYKSKVDWWLGLILFVIPISTAGVTVLRAVQGAPQTEIVIGGVSVLGVIIFYFLLVWPMHYALRDDSLEIRFGQIRTSIPYAEIRSVKPSNNILSSPALSLDRLAIEHGKAFATLISPKDKEAFMKELAEKVEGLEWNGEFVEKLM